MINIDHQNSLLDNLEDLTPEVKNGDEIYKIQCSDINISNSHAHQPGRHPKRFSENFAKKLSNDICNGEIQNNNILQALRDPRAHLIVFKKDDNIKSISIFKIIKYNDFLNNNRSIGSSHSTVSINKDIIYIDIICSCQSGYGRKVINYIYDIARQKNIDCVAALSIKVQRTLSFYNALGFQRTNMSSPIYNFNDTRNYFRSESTDCILVTRSIP